MDCDNIGRTREKPAVASVKRYLGETYRYFIDAGKRFFVNGEPVEPIDPIMLHDPETTLLIDDFIEYKFPKGHESGGQTEQIGMRLVQLPDYGGYQANRDHGLTPDRSGFYILRNRRQIAGGITFGFWARHQELSRFRGELFFPATMDVDLGVTFLKSAWAVHLTQSLRDKLQAELMPFVRQARKMYRKSATVVDDEVPDEEAARLIKRRAALLRRPSAVVEKRRSAAREGGDGEPVEPPSRSRSPVEPRVQKALASAAEFHAVDMGPTAPFYEGSLIGRKIRIDYNVAHPFYETFILDNRDNRGQIAAIDFLVYSLAAAELLATDEASYKFIGRMREDWSFNLRQLLTT